MKITFQTLTEATTPEMLAGFWDGIRPDPIEKEAANRLKRRVLGQTKETASTRVRFTRWGAVLAAACLVAVVGAALRFAPGILKINQPIETEGAGEEINQPAETGIGIADQKVIMIKIPVQYVNAAMPEGAGWETDPNDPDYISVPNYNKNGEQLISVEYCINNNRHPVKPCCDAFQKEYGIDPWSYLDPEIYFTETIPSLIGKALPIEEYLGINDYLRHGGRGYDFERELLDIGLLTWDEYEIVMKARTDFDHIFSSFQDIFNRDYFANLDEKYLKNKENVVIDNVYYNVRFLYASEELIAEMEADECISSITRYKDPFAPSVKGNDDQETEAKIEDRVTVMLNNIIIKDVPSSDPELALYLDDPYYAVTSIPIHNDRGEQLVRFRYKGTVDSKGYPCQQLSDAFQEEYGIDPKTYLDFDIFVTETVPSLVGREIPFDGKRDYWSYMNQLKEFLSEKEYDMVFAVNSAVRSQYFVFKEKFDTEYLARINEKYLSNPDNIVLRRNGIFLYASEELITEMEADERIEQVIRFLGDTFILIDSKPVDDGIVYDSFESTNN